MGVDCGCELWSGNYAYAYAHGHGHEHGRGHGHGHGHGLAHASPYAYAQEDAMHTARLRKCPAAGAAVTPKATRAPALHPHSSSAGASSDNSFGVGVVAEAIGVGADADGSVAASPMHAPSLNDTTPAARALHELLKVLPSVPHTGTNTAGHTWVVEGRVAPKAASSRPEAPSRDATTRVRIGRHEGASSRRSLGGCLCYRLKMQRI